MTTPISEVCLKSARAFRGLFASQIPTDPCQRDTMTAHEFTQLVEEQTKEAYERCGRAVAQIIPELFADFWEAKLEVEGALP